MEQKQLDKNKQFWYRHVNKVLVDIYSYGHNKKKISKNVGLISIIMLSFNRVEDTIFSIKELYKYTKLPFELIILDNNSDRDQKDLLRRFLKKKKNVEFIESDTNLGCARGRLIAAKKAKGKYLLK